MRKRPFAAALAAAVGYLCGTSSSRAAELPFAETYFETIGDRDSIPSGSVTALAEDASGLLWVGTLSGLVRYDGYRFRRFQHDPKDPRSLGGSNIRAIQPAPDGRIWIACEDQGLSVYDPTTELFTRLVHSDRDPGSLASNAVLTLARDGDGGLWAGTATSGLDYLPPGATRFEHHGADPRNPDALRLQTVRRLLVDRRGNLWIAGVGGLDLLRPHGRRFEHVAADPADPSSLSGHYVYALFEAHDGRIWIGLQDGGAAWLDPDTLKVTRLPVDPSAPDGLSHPWIDAFAETRDGQIWLASFGGGIDVLDSASRRIVRRIRQNISVPGGLAVDRVTLLKTDRSGLLWVGTWGGGLQRHNPTASAFQTLRYDPTRTSRLGHPTVHCALEMTDGRIWLGTGGRGIDVLDRARGVVESLRPDPSARGALRDGLVLSIARSKDGTVWVATQQAGLHRYLGPGTGFRVVETAPKRIRQLFAGRTGSLVIGTENGIYELDPVSERSVPLLPDDGQPVNLAVWGIVEGADGNLWVGTPRGLYLRSAGQPALHRLEAPPPPAIALSQQGVSSLLLDRRGRLWVATNLGIERLTRVEGGRGYFEQFPGFTASVMRMLDDGDGRIWTERYVLDTERKLFDEFGRSDGVDVGNPPEIGRAAATRDGLLLFGASSGLLIIDPSRFRRWGYEPPLVLTELRVDGSARPAPAFASGLRLEPRHKDFALEVASLDYSASERNRYRYRLDGYDDRWVEADSGHRTLGFTNLAPGGYTLRVQGSNRTGAWSPHELRPPVTVVPALRLEAQLSAGELATGETLARLKAELGGAAPQLVQELESYIADFDHARAAAAAERLRRVLGS